MEMSGCSSDSWENMMAMSVNNLVKSDCNSATLDCNLATSDCNSVRLESTTDS